MNFKNLKQLSQKTLNQEISTDLVLEELRNLAESLNSTQKEYVVRHIEFIKTIQNSTENQQDFAEIVATQLEDIHEYLTKKLVQIS